MNKKQKKIVNEKKANDEKYKIMVTYNIRTEV